MLFQLLMNDIGIKKNMVCVLKLYWSIFNVCSWTFIVCYCAIVNGTFTLCNYKQQWDNKSSMAFWKQMHVWIYALKILHVLYSLKYNCNHFWSEYYMYDLWVWPMQINSELFLNFLNEEWHTHKSFVYTLSKDILDSHFA